MKTLEISPLTPDNFRNFGSYSRLVEMAYSEQVCVELGPWNAVILEILEEKI